MRPRWWTGRGAAGTGLLAVGLAAVAVHGPSARADTGDHGDAVAGALAALRDNGSQLGFDDDGQGPAGLGKQYGVTATDVMVDPDGSTFVRMDRTFAGLPVLGGDFVVHRIADGRWVGASATLRRSLDNLGVTPALSPIAAITTAGIGLGTRVARLLGTPTLVVDTLHGSPALAWEVVSGGTQPDGTPSRMHTLVDAQTGKVRDAAEEVQSLRRTDQPVPGGGSGSAAPAAGSADPQPPSQSDGPQSDGRQSGPASGGGASSPQAQRATTEAQGKPTLGEGHSLYVGKVKLSTALLSGTYALKDLTRGAAFTGDAEDTQDNCLPVASLCASNAPATQFTSKTNDWGNGQNANRESAAVDATYGSDMTWDYYKNTFKRSGVNNDGIGVFSRVHYGKNYANAFWSDDCFCMTYGDGDGKQLGPLVSLDITGHEITHGVTARTAKLGGDGESGGLNEANSDIFGTMVEFTAHNAANPGDYLIGSTSFIERRDKDGKLNAIRYMDQPSKDKSSPDCWSSSVRNLDVHLSAGIGDHFFYLLSEGSGKKTVNGISYDSPTCDNKKVGGIGRETAANIWYRALTHYFTSGTDYAAARAAVVSAATDLYGAKSAQVAAVNAAWDAVNVHLDDDSSGSLGGGLF
ncbi:MAG TPA: M4 family metallopeptidase [Sporichthyaceae bacterium]|jgi:Zn-dependent metalloprotease|nr:M4 family metallopeptidase [Sporichthyaceae bacterium]